MSTFCKMMVAGLVFALATANAWAAIVATNSTYGLFDDFEGIRILNVTSHGRISDLNVIIEFAKCDDPPIGPNGSGCLGTGRSFDREIAFRLTGPDGAVFRLVDYFTYTGQTPGAGRIAVIFDDQSAAAVGGEAAAGRFRPIDMLDAFNGRDMFGVYTLYISDGAQADPLEFFSASLDVTRSAAAIPETGSLALLGLGLLVLEAARRRAPKPRRQSR